MAKIAFADELIDDIHASETAPEEEGGEEGGIETENMPNPAKPENMPNPIKPENMPNP